MRPLLLTLLLATPAAAQDTLEEWNTRCQQTAQNEPEMQACFEQGIAATDEKLQATLTRWLTSTEDDLPQDAPRHEALIRESFAARTALAQLECEDETFASIRGSGYGTILAQCILRKRIEHLAYLSALAEYY